MCKLYAVNSLSVKTSGRAPGALRSKVDTNAPWSTLKGGGAGRDVKTLHKCTADQKGGQNATHKSTADLQKGGGGGRKNSYQSIEMKTQNSTCREKHGSNAQSICNNHYI